MKTSDRGP